MKGKRTLTIAIIAGVLAVVGGLAISAQDKYTLESAEWARVLRVQRIRGLAGCLHQSGRTPDGCDPRESCDDQGLPGRRSR